MLLLSIKNLVNTLIIYSKHCSVPQRHHYLNRERPFSNLYLSWLTCCDTIWMGYKHSDYVCSDLLFLFYRPVFADAKILLSIWKRNIFLQHVSLSITNIGPNHAKWCLVNNCQGVKPTQSIMSWWLFIWKVRQTILGQVGKLTYKNIGSRKQSN